jgi:hypothetical protein
MRVATSIVLALVVLAGPASLTASGPLGIYGIVERVVFEPDEKAPDRVQVWGAFAYVDLRSEDQAVSAPQRGYLYLTLPIMLPASRSQVDVIRREWADLKAVAGTGQAVGFGSWGYSGRFSNLRPDATRAEPPHIFEASPKGGTLTDLRVRPASEAPTAPAGYQTNTGIVRLAADGSHAAIVKQLKGALNQR